MDMIVVIIDQGYTIYFASLIMGAYKSVMFCSLCMQQGEINSWATDF
jgi:hypothetical protein